MINGKFTQKEKDLISERTRLAMANPEVRKKLSEKLKGRVAWNKGLKTGKPAWNSGKKGSQISWNKGKECPQVRGKKNGNWKGGKPSCVDCGKALSRREYTRCFPCSVKTISGENHYNWKGGDANPLRILRSSYEYKAWRLSVYERDWFTCQMPRCGYKGGNIECHHIKRVKENPELILNISNGITLCKDCHKKTRNKEEQFAKLFKQIIAVIKNLK